jgi:PAS domain S-box-containing protein
MSEDKKTEERAQREENYFDQLFETAPESIAIIDLQKRVTRVNRGFLHMFGYVLNEVIGQFIDDIVVPVERSEEAKNLTTSLYMGASFIPETIRRKKDGSFLDVSIIGAPILIAGQLEAVYLIYRDITEQKQTAQRIEAQNKEFIFQNGEKEKRAAELAVANQELLFQNGEKEKRAAELVVANQELLFQNGEKEKRAAELVVANQELLFQNEEKEKRAVELAVANQELLFQNKEKEKRAAELVVANEEIIKRLQNIQSLHRIDQAIAGSLDLTLTLDIVLEQVKAQLNVDAVDVLLLNQYANMLEFTSGIGFYSKAIERSRLQLGDGLGGQAVLERKTVSIPNFLENGTQFIRASLLASEGFLSYFATPLIAKGQINGLLEVYNRSPFSPDENWLEFFKIMAGQAAIAVDNANLFAKLKQSNEHLFAAYDSTIEGWSHALDLRDKETEGHTQRVAEMAIKLGRVAGIDEKELLYMRRGALLHDIGKMGIPDSILLKPGSLTGEEWVVMRRHPTIAFELLSPIAYLRPAIDIPYCHHENWDGSGYPRGLEGEQIPLSARLFAVVDVWDALRSDRPYRKAWPEEQVLEHIRSLVGTHFDPKAVELFMEMVKEDTK